MTREDVWLDFNQTVAGWLLSGTGLFSIDRRQDGALAGFAIVHHEYGDSEVELGWILTAEVEGHGYATKAAGAPREHAATLGLTASSATLTRATSARSAGPSGSARAGTQGAEAAIGHVGRVYRHPASE